MYLVYQCGPDPVRGQVLVGQSTSTHRFVSWSFGFMPEKSSGKLRMDHENQLRIYVGRMLCFLLIIQSKGKRVVCATSRL